MGRNHWEHPTFLTKRLSICYVLFDTFSEALKTNLTKPVSWSHFQRGEVPVSAAELHSFKVITSYAFSRYSICYTCQTRHVGFIMRIYHNQSLRPVTRSRCLFLQMITKPESQRPSVEGDTHGNCIGHDEFLDMAGKSIFHMSLLGGDSSDLLYAIDCNIFT